MNFWEDLLPEHRNENPVTLSSQAVSKDRFSMTLSVDIDHPQLTFLAELAAHGCHAQFKATAARGRLRIEVKGPNAVTPMVDQPKTLLITLPWLPYSVPRIKKPMAVVWSAYHPWLYVDLPEWALPAPNEMPRPRKRLPANLKSPLPKPPGKPLLPVQPKPEPESTPTKVTPRERAKAKLAAVAESPKPMPKVQSIALNPLPVAASKIGPALLKDVAEVENTRAATVEPVSPSKVDVTVQKGMTVTLIQPKKRDAYL